MTQKDYQALATEANRHSDLYYNAGTPEITDAQFDALVAQIEAYEAAYPDHISPDSPTQKVGAAVADGSAVGQGKVRHLTPMLSQQKCHTIEELEAWINATNTTLGHEATYHLSWKYDGVSCSLVYQDGKLVSAATRGDGNMGQDITQHALHIQGIPQQLRKSVREKYEGRIEIREAKSGRRTPVAHVRPITIKGKTISKVNLFTEKTMRELGVTEGSTVRVILQNDVTPKIASVIPTATEPTTTEAATVLGDSVAEPTTAPTPRTTRRAAQRAADDAERANRRAYEEACAIRKPFILLEPHYSEPATSPTLTVEPTATEAAPYSEPLELPTPLPSPTADEAAMMPEPTEAESSVLCDSVAGQDEARAESTLSVIGKVAASIIALAAAGTLCVCGIGLAFFFLPLLGGAFKSNSLNDN